MESINTEGNCLVVGQGLAAGLQSARQGAEGRHKLAAPLFFSHHPNECKHMRKSSRWTK
jgi:hypothetical protein